MPLKIQVGIDVSKNRLHTLQAFCPAEAEMYSMHLLGKPNTTDSIADYEQTCKRDRP